MMVRLFPAWSALCVAVAMSVFAHNAIADEAHDECPAAGMSWTAENIQQCIDDLTKRVDQAVPGSAQLAKLLAQRAELRQSLGSFVLDDDPVRANAVFEAALADYSAALEINPQAAPVRYVRARLLMRMERNGEALKDADALVAQDPGSVDFNTLKGMVLAALKRDPEAIEVYTHAIALAQSCAEASAVQRRVNEYRHAFDPPLTKEQMLEEMRDKSRPRYDIPEAGVMNLGFPCMPSGSNTFDNLVTSKGFLLQRRGDSYRALGDANAVLVDYKYAVAISPLPELESVSLCALQIELGITLDAAETCRRGFDNSSTWVVLADPVLAAKIGTFLLNDGDIKGPCRIAVPFATVRSMRAYYDHPYIKALQKRVRRAMKAAGMSTC